MKPGLVPLFLFLTLIPIAGLLACWFTRWFLQKQVDDVDRGELAADVANATGGRNVTV